MTKSEQARVNILFYLKSVAIGSPVSDELRDILIEEANKVPKSYWHKIEPYTEGSIYGMVIAALVSNSGENLYEFVKTIAKYFDWDDIVPFTSDRGIDLILKITSPFKIGIVQEIFEHSNDAVRKKIAQYAFKHFGQNVDFCNYLAEKMGYQLNLQGASGHRIGDFPHAVFHKGALNTLVAERNELVKMIGNVEAIMQMHINGLEKLGVKIRTN
jgi:hypothetical protein